MPKKSKKAGLHLQTMKVGLEGIQVRAKTAYYEWERNLGVNLIMDVLVELNKLPKVLSESVDYVHVHAIIKEESKAEYQLLEELAHVIASRILAEDGNAKEVYIKIRKPFLPIPSYQGNGSVIEHSLSR